MNILCWFGLHSWGSVGFSGFVMPATVYQCKTCGVGRARHFNYTETFTAKEMRAALESDRARLRALLDGSKENDNENC